MSSRSAQPLSAAEECALKPKDVFKECDKCPEMVVVPSGAGEISAARGAWPLSRTFSRSRTYAGFGLRVGTENRSRRMAAFLSRY
jgi:hypothetical protein